MSGEHPGYNPENESPKTVRGVAPEANEDRRPPDTVRGVGPSDTPAVNGDVISAAETARMHAEAQKELAKLYGESSSGEASLDDVTENGWRGAEVVDTSENIQIDRGSQVGMNAEGYPSISTKPKKPPTESFSLKPPEESK